MQKAKDKERILKAAREKQLVIHKEASLRLSADFSTETSQAKGIGKKYSKWWKARTHNQDYSNQKHYHLELKNIQRAPQIKKKKKS